MPMSRSVIATLSVVASPFSPMMLGGASTVSAERLADGTYGRSVRSGDPIPDERLEADPAAELTVEEATEHS